MTVLLDGNVLVALTVPSHIHHDAAHEWWSARDEQGFATCPITQGTLLRMAVRKGAAIEQALSVLESICGVPGHQFWPDDVAYQQVSLSGVIGHRQLTDAYLAQLARNRSGRLATFDRGLAALHADVEELVPYGD